MKGGYASLSGSGGLSKKEIKKIIEELLTEQILETVNVVQKFNYWFNSAGQIWGRYTPASSQTAILGPKNMSIIAGIAEYEQLRSTCPWYLWDYVNFPYVPALLAPVTYADNPQQYKEFDYMPTLMTKPIMDLNYQFKQGNFNNDPVGQLPDVIQIDFREFITRALVDPDIQKFIEYGFIEDMDDVYYRVHIEGQLIVGRMSGGWNSGAYVITHVYSTEYPNGTSPDNLGTTQLIEDHFNLNNHREYTRVQISEQNTDIVNYLPTEINCTTHWFNLSTIVQLSFVPVPINAWTGGGAQNITAQVLGRGGELRISLETAFKPKTLI